MCVGLEPGSWKSIAQYSNHFPIGAPPPTVEMNRKMKHHTDTARRGSEPWSQSWVANHTTIQSMKTPQIHQQLNLYTGL